MVTEILVDRITSNASATLSNIFINDVFECFGLEDEFRYEKVIGETRIPAGRYKVKLRTVGGFDGRYRSKFPDFHKGMLHVQDVPGFEYILIHVGNTEKDTAGCLLVGKNATTLNALTVPASTQAYKSLYQKVVYAADADALFITYQDRDIA
jgi:hypothetical protein